MEIIEQVTNDLSISKEILARSSLRTFLDKELANTEAEMYKISARHGIKSVLEFDALLKKGKILEEDIIDDFTELDYLESRRDKLLKALEKIR